MIQKSLLVIFWLFSAVRIDAMELRALIAADTEAETIGRSVQKDLQIVQKELRLISSYTELPLIEKVFNGSELNALAEQIEEMNLSQEDILFFYFSGHGFRSKRKKDIWPYLFFSNSEKKIDFYTLAEKLKQKNPRLLIAIADTCNIYNPGSRSIPNIAFSLSIPNAFNPALFLEKKGALLISSARPGEPSYSSEKHGSCFTRHFFQALRKHASLPDPDWEAILSETALKVYQITQNQGCPQHIQYLMEISS